MSLTFGHDELEPNHVHNIKPLIALPYYQLMIYKFQFIYSAGIDYNVWRQPSAEKSHIPRREVVTNGWVEAKYSELDFFAHTFDNDPDIRELTMRYELVCLMHDGTKEYKLINKFDLMSFKITTGLVDNINHFLFNRKKIYYISDIQPNFKNMFKMSIQTKRTSQNPSSINNESFLEIITLHTQLMKPVNDIMLKT